MRPDESCVLLDGPWRHRQVSANGRRFHVAEVGDGPMVMLLHGFPEFWGAWRHHMPVLAGAGFRAVAVDLRGFGASDKPPRGYDAYTLAADASGLVRALGERNAMMVGADWGASLAWTTATFHPQTVRGVVVLGAAHPRRMRAALAAGPRAQRSASTHLVAFQTPRYEHRVTRDDAAYVGDLMRRWSGQQWPETDDFAEYAQLCRKAIQIPQASFCAMEYSRWAMRSLTRPSGWRYLSLMAEPVHAPTLQLHGSRDGCVLPSTALGSGKYVAGRYEWRLLHGVGHFPQHEAADVVAGELARWAKETTAAPHPK